MGKVWYKRYRKEVIGKLLSGNAPQLLAAENSGASGHIVRALFRNNGILVKKGATYIITVPDSNKYPAMAKVWDLIDNYVRRCTNEKPVSDLIDKLKSLFEISL